jgi:hypothetical protein
MTYARTTEVPVDRSKAEIEKTLSRYGATKFFTGWDTETAVIGFNMADRFVEFRLPLPKAADFFRTSSGSSRSHTAATKAHEQAQRSAWRALLLCIKAKLESVDSGIETFEEAFLSHIMVSDGEGGSTTIGRLTIPQLDGSYAGGTPMLALPRTTA